jgi:hypothetical protein
MNFHYLKTSLHGSFGSRFEIGNHFLDSRFVQSYRRLITTKSNCAWRYSFLTPVIKIKFLTAFPWCRRTGFSSCMRQLDSRNGVLSDDETVYLLHLFDLLIFPKP